MGPTGFISHTLNLFSLPDPPSKLTWNFPRHFGTDSPQGDNLWWPGPVARHHSSFTAESLFCFLFNYYFETHLKYFGSTRGSGNSKLKPLLSCSWPSQTSRTWGPRYANRHWCSSKHTTGSRHRSLPARALKEQNYVNRYTALSSLGNKMQN